ncbi:MULTISPECIES: signal peptidase II [Pseudomonas fluorescens group]|uniref:Lipoprotein signal peptidase n=1 Tax=Pseudomonas azotoformans TaxID=47878 RepID=A0A127I3U4_PSEAZ|nr:MULTISPECIES: signal peptidase II [Pseudomonas fluorescens group]AMN81373.1 signal peptidase II [Pseudomonas azotoformans]ETK24847.1 prolipoprotein signal peptidase (Signal peptidase II.) [Pseudomonas sp. FH1]
MSTSSLLRSRTFALFAGIAFVAIDQLVKLLALVSLQANSFKFGASPLNLALELSLNPGAFLSLGAALPSQVKQLIFIVGVAVVVAWAMGWSLSNWSQPLRKVLPLYAIALGGIANLIDRVFRDGHVVDYMVLNVGPTHTGVFNIADIAITAGAIYLMIDLLVQPRKA